MPSTSSSLLACLAVAAALAIAPAAADVTPPPGLNCGAAEVAQCGGDPVATGCDVLELQGAVADRCGGGGRHAFYSPFNRAALPNGFGFGRRKLIFEENNGVSSGTLVKSGSTARLTGRLVPGRCVGGPGRGPDNKRIENAVCTPTTTADGFDIDMHLVATTTNRIKNENRCGSAQGVDPSTWTHWDLDTTQNNTLTGFGSVEGLTVHLRLVLNAGYPWHEGYGASQKNRFYGLSSWINFERIEIGPTYTGPQPLNIPVGSSRNHMGDLNLAAGCACRCVCPQGNCTPPDDVCGNGILDVGEDCDPGIADSGCCHDNCTFIQDSLCRAADGECDQPEYCTGSSASCPTDTFLNNVPCGGRFGLCDVSVRAQCDGSGPLCPQDAPALLETNQGPVDFHRFNAISFGNLYAVSGDVEGRAAVRDHFSVGAFSVGDKLCTGVDAGCCDIPQPFSLVVGRNAHWEGGALYPLGYPNTDACGSPGECAFVGGNATGDGPSSQASPLPEMVCGICGIRGEGCLDAQFDAAQQYFTAVSDALAAAPDNAVYSTRYQAIEVMCNSANESRYTVTIPDTVLSAATWWTVSNCNFDAEWVINVGGTGNVLFTGGDLGTVVERTIFNVPGMNRQVNVTNTQLPGNLLAPHSTLYQPGGVILANVVVGSIEFMLQINHPNCTAFREVDLRVFLVSQGSQRRQGSTSVGVAGCPPDDVLVVASHGQFLPGDLVTISVGPQGPSEQARIDELLLVGPSPGEYAFRFTAPLTNAGDYTATSTVTMTVPDPVNSGRTPAAVTRQTAAYPCAQPPSTPATGDVSAAPVAASASSAIAVVAMMLLALVW